MMVRPTESETANMRREKINNKLLADPTIALADDGDLFWPRFSPSFSLLPDITQMSPSRKETRVSAFTNPFRFQRSVCTNYLQAINQDLGFLIKSFNSSFFRRLHVVQIYFCLFFLMPFQRSFL